MLITDGGRRNVLLLYLLAGLTSVSYGAVELIYPLNLDRLDHPLPLVGATVALRGVGSLLATIPAGAWYELGRARRLLAGALALMGLSAIGLSIGSWCAIQATLGLVHGFACGLATTFLLALLIEVRPRQENAAPTMAWYTAALSTGYAAGASLWALSTEWLGYEAAFVISGLVGLVAAGLVLALDPPPDEVPEESGRHAAVATERGPRALAHLPASIRLATLLAFYINFANETIGTFFPIYAVGLGISLAAVGFFKSATFLAATAIRFGSAALFRFLDVGIANHASIVMMALGTLALSVFTTDPVLLVVFVVLGVSRGLLRVTSMTIVAEQRGRPGASVGMASGVYNCGLGAGAILGPPIAGALAGVLGIPATFQIVALALPALYYLVWFVHSARPLRRAGAAENTVAG